MRTMLFHVLLAATLLFAGAATASETNEQKRDSIRKMAAESLNQLYKVQPASKTAIQKSAGYAVFDDMGVKVLFVSSARGSGMAVNTKTKKSTYRR